LTHFITISAVLGGIRRFAGWQAGSILAGQGRRRTIVFVDECAPFQQVESKGRFAAYVEAQAVHLHWGRLENPSFRGQLRLLLSRAGVVYDAATPESVQVLMLKGLHALLLSHVFSCSCGCLHMCLCAAGC
jgi:replication-associated recombination protein RarA